MKFLQLPVVTIEVSELTFFLILYFHGYTISFISKKPNNIIQHVSTKDAVIHDSNVIGGGLLKFEGFYSRKVTEWQNYLILSDIA